jgi:phosphoserine/homoserine phosphotransferase
MHAVCSDLEGIWVPEVWINVARNTGIDELKLTTRDIKDYNELMQYRLRIKIKRYTKCYRNNKTSGRSSGND